MFKKLVPLKKDDHIGLRLRRADTMEFARGEIMAPIVLDEIADVAREYPIVFPMGSKLPVALLGVEEGNNAYISLDGSWRATYIPAHIRQYPFALARLGSGPKADSANGDTNDEQISLGLMIDIESPLVSLTAGTPLFDDSGALSPVAQSSVALMRQLVQREALTVRLVAALDAAGLLLERTVRIQDAGGQERQVTGLRMIDEKALNALDDAAFTTLRKAGALPLVYAALLSWANFRQGPIGRSHPIPARSEPLSDEIIRFN
jgi:hypothetical protein